LHSLTETIYQLIYNGGYLVHKIDDHNHHIDQHFYKGDHLEDDRMHDSGYRLQETCNLKLNSLKIKC